MNTLLLHIYASPCLEENNKKLYTEGRGGLIVLNLKKLWEHTISPYLNNAPPRLLPWQPPPGPGPQVRVRQPPRVVSRLRGRLVDAHGGGAPDAGGGGALHDGEIPNIIKYK